MKVIENVILVRLNFLFIYIFLRYNPSCFFTALLNFIEEYKTFYRQNRFDLSSEGAKNKYI